MRKTIFACCAAIAACLAGTGQAANLVLNGDFEITSTPGSNGFGDYYPSNTVQGWDTTGYNFIFAPGTADTTGAQGQYGQFNLWGPGNGAANGLTATSPTGGNFVGADGAFEVGPLFQTINGLTVGKNYTVSFWWAAAQQQSFNGPTTEDWTVSLGTQSFTTGTANTPDHGFVPWTKEAFTFTAQNTSDTLSFLAHGTPDGQPPFSLLDGVSLNEAVPEPATWAMMFLGFGIIGAALRSRRPTGRMTAFAGATA